MKSHAFLINTAGGGLINEADLADALNINRIAGAALDVLSAEPPTDAGGHRKEYQGLLAGKPGNVVN